MKKTIYIACAFNDKNHYIKRGNIYTNLEDAIAEAKSFKVRPGTRLVVESTTDYGKSFTTGSQIVWEEIKK